MTEAYVFDAIRTPRGKGKKDGSLYEVKPVNLLAGVLTELQRRNDFDTGQVDDVVMEVVVVAARDLVTVGGLSAASAADPLTIAHVDGSKTFSGTVLRCGRNSWTITTSSHLTIQALCRSK